MTGVGTIVIAGSARSAGMATRVQQGGDDGVVVAAYSSCCCPVYMSH